MTTYTATFHSDACWSRREFDAATPEEALVLARRYADEDPGRLDFEPYDLDPINEIAIKDDDGNELTVWRDNDLRLRLAAGPMLDALRHALAALNTASRFKVPGLAMDSYAIAAMCGRAIALASPAEGGSP